MLYLSLFIIGLLCWLIATITAGGAGLLFLAFSGLILPLPIATMVLGFSGTVAGFYRVWVYRNNLDWSILKWLIPGTLLGTILGTLLFSYLIKDNNVFIIKIFLGLFLIFSGFLGYFKLNVFNVPAKKHYFLFSGVFTSFISGLVGASGPIMNSLFQKFSLKPNQIIGTKSFNIFLLQLGKTIIFLFSVVLSHRAMLNDRIISTKEFLYLGITTAFGSIVGVYAGKKILNKIDENIFGKILNLMMFTYGIYTLSSCLLF